MRPNLPSSGQESILQSQRIPLRLKRRHPRPKHDQASHFVYEANLHLSACIAKACEGDPSALRRLPPLLDVHTANAYLAASGSGQRLTPNQTAGQERHAS